MRPLKMRSFQFLTFDRHLLTPTGTSTYSTCSGVIGRRFLAKYQLSIIIVS